MRLKHYSPRTYCDWIKQFVKLHRTSEKQALCENSEEKIEALLSYLANERNVAAATQNQAMNALVFLLSAVFKFNETAYRDL